MVHKINVQDSRQGILTFRRKANHMEATVLLPKETLLEVGDGIAEMRYFKQVGNQAQLIKVDEILEERPSRGKWSNDNPPTWRKMIVSLALFTVEQTAGVVRVNGEALVL